MQGSSSLACAFQAPGLVVKHPASGVVYDEAVAVPTTPCRGDPFNTSGTQQASAADDDPLAPPAVSTPSKNEVNDDVHFSCLSSSLLRLPRLGLHPHAMLRRSTDSPRHAHTAVVSPTARSSAQPHASLASDEAMDGDAAMSTAGSPTQQQSQHQDSTWVSRVQDKSAELQRVFGLPPDEEIVDDYLCAIRKRILLQGRMYVFQHHVCFYANIFGYVKNKVIPFKEINAVRKRKNYGFPNSLEITWRGGKREFFTSFLSRDEAFNLILYLWHSNSPYAKLFEGQPKEIKVPKALNRGGTLSVTLPMMPDPSTSAALDDTLGGGGGVPSGGAAAAAPAATGVPSEQQQGQQSQQQAERSQPSSASCKGVAFGRQLIRKVTGVGGGGGSSRDIPTNDFPVAEELQQVPESAAGPSSIPAHRRSPSPATAPSSPMLTWLDGSKVKGESSLATWLGPRPPAGPTPYGGSNGTPNSNPNGNPNDDAASSTASASPLGGGPGVGVGVEPRASSLTSSGVINGGGGDGGGGGGYLGSGVQGRVGTLADVTPSDLQLSASGGGGGGGVAGGGGGGGGNGTLRTEDDDEEGGSAGDNDSDVCSIADGSCTAQGDEPAPSPQPDMSVLLEVSCLAVPVREFVQRFLSDTSGFYADFHTSNGDRNVELTPWRRHAVMGHVRELHFVANLRGKSTLGPSEALCHQTQRYRMYAGKHLVFETSQVMPEIPYGDHFSVETRWDVTPVPSPTGAGVSGDGASNVSGGCGSQACRVVVGVRIPFNRNVIWKKAIERNVRDQTRSSMQKFFARVEDTLQPPPAVQEEQRALVAAQQQQQGEALVDGVVPSGSTPDEEENWQAVLSRLAPEYIPEFERMLSIRADAPQGSAAPPSPAANERHDAQRDTATHRDGKSWRSTAAAAAGLWSRSWRLLSGGRVLQPPIPTLEQMRASGLSSSREAVRMLERGASGVAEALTVHWGPAASLTALLLLLCMVLSQLALLRRIDALLERQAEQAGALAAALTQLALAAQHGGGA